MFNVRINWKHVLCFIFSLWGLILILSFDAKAEYCGDYEYVIDKNTNCAMLIAYRGNESEVNIPKEVDGHTVEKLEHGLFENRKKIQKVNIPSTVKNIQSRVFYKNTSLKTIEIPDNVTYLGSEAFYGCSSLESVTIGKGIKSIMYGTFAECIKLSTVNLSEGLEVISGYQWGDGVFFGCKSLEEIKLPNTLRSILLYAFYNCDGLKEVYIPDSVTNIGSYAFGSCSKLEKISIGKGVKEIPDHMIRNCNNLKKIIFRGEDISTIGTMAFAECTALEEIIMPKKLDEIGFCAFGSCTSLKKISLNEGLTRIADQAFSRCIALEEITIPSSVIDFIGNVFVGCKNLKTIVLKANLSNSYGNPFVDLGCEDNELLIKAYSNNEFLKTMKVKDDDLIFRVEYIDAIPSESIQFEKESIMLSLGDSITLPATMTPIDSTDSIMYKVGNKNVATINQRGKITAVGYGGTIITARTNSNKVAQIKVYVRPKKVTGFKDIAIGVKTVKLQWNEQENVDGYYVYKKEGAKWNNILDVTAKSKENINRCLITNLSSGTIHQFAINAYKKLNGKIYRSTTFPQITIFTLPNKVTNFRKSVVSKTTIKTVWNKVNGASGYILYRYQNGKWVRVAVTNKNYFTYTKLRRNTTYKFCIKAYKKVGTNIGYGGITYLTSKTRK